MLKRSLTLMIAGSFGSIAAACTSSPVTPVAGDANAIKIGFMSPLSGADADNGAGAQRPKDGG